MKKQYRECEKCKARILISILDDNLSICPECGNYLRFHARKRIEMLADKNTFKEWENKNQISNPLNDILYEKKFKNEVSQHNLKDAIVDGESLKQKSRGKPIKKSMTNKPFTNLVFVHDR